MRSMARWLTTCAVVVALAGSAPGLPAIRAQSAPPWLPLAVVTRAASTRGVDARQALDQLAEQWRPGYAPMLLDLAEFSRVPRWAGPAVDLSQPVGATDVAGSPSRACRTWAARRCLARVAGPRSPAPVSRACHPASGSASTSPSGTSGSGRSRTIRIPSTWRSRDGSMRTSTHGMADFFSPAVAGQHPARRNRVGRGGRQRDSAARLPEDDSGGRGTLPARQPHRLRGRRQRPRPRLPAAHPRVARARAGSRRRRRADGRLLHAVRRRSSRTTAWRAGAYASFGTSGLLYRSNKLMFDEETNSLWSTLDGRPVVGPLVGSDAVLTSRAAVTTTWGEWRRRHPQTDVLSLDTGHDRDYSEGAAYRHYFGTDRLMFSVPTTDTRLSNKAEVLVMRLPLGADRSAADRDCRGVPGAAPGLSDAPRRPRCRHRHEPGRRQPRLRCVGAELRPPAAGRPPAGRSERQLAGHRRRACGRWTSAAPAARRAARLLVRMARAVSGHDPDQVVQACSDRQLSERSR